VLSSRALETGPRVAADGTRAREGPARPARRAPAAGRRYRPQCRKSGWAAGSTGRPPGPGGSPRNLSRGSHVLL